MKIATPEVAWHNRDPVYSVDIQPQLQKSEDGSTGWYRVATSGADSAIVMWKIEASKTGGRVPRVDPSNVLSLLTRHEKAVNVVRFVPTGEEVLASADVDGVILIWKKGDLPRFAADLEQPSGRSASPKAKEKAGENSEKDQAADKESPFEQVIQNIENWNQHKVLRGHLEDVVDISWSKDGLFLVSASVDNEAIVWDVTKGTKTHMLSGHKSWVQGVAWDPLDQFVITLSADRSLRVFSGQSKKIVYRVEKSTLRYGDEDVKSKLFYDYTLPSFTRRLWFSPGGEFLLVPSGVLEFPKKIPSKADPKSDSHSVIVDDDVDGEHEPTSDADLNYINVCHLFLRNSLQKPHAYLPTLDRFCHAVRFCPTRYCLREGQENPFPFPYRIVFAVATQNSVIFYDSQQATPFAFLSDIHYTRISDVAWSADGRLFMISSTDGFCTIVSFDEGELGQVYEGEGFRFAALCVSPGKADGDGVSAAEPATPEAGSAGATVANGASATKTGKSATPKLPPEPIVKTPSVVSFFSKVTKEKQLESMEKALQELDSTAKAGKKRAISEVTLDDSSEAAPASPKTPVKTDKKPRRINLITLMKPKDKEGAA